MIPVELNQEAIDAFKTGKHTMKEIALLCHTSEYSIRKWISQDPEVVRARTRSISMRRNGCTPGYIADYIGKTYFPIDFRMITAWTNHVGIRHDGSSAITLEAIKNQRILKSWKRSTELSEEITAIIKDKYLTYFYRPNSLRRKDDGHLIPVREKYRYKRCA